MTEYLFPEEHLFPPVDLAEPDGLLAIGGDFSIDRLLLAYSSGIFPWFMDEDDIYWYSPDPRLVLYPDKFHKTTSLSRVLKSGKFTVRIDTHFEQVMKACAEIERPGQEGTWITREFIEAYTKLHHLGLAHSIETYYKDDLVGGLYGVSLGSAFFGESMFSLVSNASKVAFTALVELCIQFRFTFIDCQVESSHLLTLGAESVDREFYLSLLQQALKSPTLNYSWQQKSLSTQISTR